MNEYELVSLGRKRGSPSAFTSQLDRPEGVVKIVSAVSKRRE